ncbi:AraC family transcriptional regulator [Bacillus subtilis]|nr:AraC family transcriptional regulator [Bacillus subtilis]
MTSDLLSDVLDLISVRGVVSGGAVITGAWRATAPVDEPLKFCALAHGEAWLSTDGIDGPIHLVAGELAVLNGRSFLSLESRDSQGQAAITEITPPSSGEMVRLGDGAEPEMENSDVDVGGSEGGQADVFIGGRIDLEDDGRDLLLSALPPVVHVRSDAPAAERVSGFVRRIVDELALGRPGADFAVREYGQLLILEVLRECMDGDTVPSGWLTLLGDKRLRPAVQNMHASPGASWSLDDLARVSAMSRTAFAVRFREVAGMPPQAYLVRWRMVLAKRELRLEDTRLRELAHRLGYASESSFSSAFKRSVGEAPRSYRARMLSAG